MQRTTRNNTFTDSVRIDVIDARAVLRCVALLSNAALLLAGLLLRLPSSRCAMN